MRWNKQWGPSLWLGRRRSTAIGRKPAGLTRTLRPICGVPGALTGHSRAHAARSDRDDRCPGPLAQASPNMNACSMPCVRQGLRPPPPNKLITRCCAPDRHGMSSLSIYPRPSDVGPWARRQRPRALAGGLCGRRRAAPAQLGTHRPGRARQLGPMQPRRVDEGRGGRGVPSGSPAGGGPSGRPCKRDRRASAGPAVPLSLACAQAIGVGAAAPDERGRCGRARQRKQAVRRAAARAVALGRRRRGRVCR